MENAETASTPIQEEPSNENAESRSPPPPPSNHVEFSAPPPDVSERLDKTNDQRKDSVFLRGEQISYLFEHLHGKDAEPPASNCVFCSDPICDEYIDFVARTGRPLFCWPVIKSLIIWKLESVMTEISQSIPFDHLSKVPNTDRSSSRQYMERIASASQSLTGIPFTIQRICELLSQPRKHYRRADRFYRALEKNVSVVTTVDVEGRRETERQPNEGTNIAAGAHVNNLSSSNVNEDQTTRNHAPQ